MESVFIKEICISKLFGYKNINWSISGNVGVLVGENGKGKSTILRIINNSLSNSKNKTIKNNLFDLHNSVKIEFSNGVVFNSKPFKISRENISEFISFLREASLGKKVTKESFDKALKKVATDKGGQAFFEEVRIEHNGLYNEKDDFFDFLDVISISTEDVFFNARNEIKGSDGEDLNVIEMEIENNIKKISKNLKLKKINLEDVSKVEDGVNRFFSGKNGGDYIDDNKKVFFHYDNEDLLLKIKMTRSDNIINISDLSSGEKQIIYIFTKIAAHSYSGKQLILLMDEPEISLHLSWQEIFIEELLKLNSKMQIIIATHSPAILMKGWMGAYKEIDDITTLEEI